MNFLKIFNVLKIIAPFKPSIHPVLLFANAEKKAI